MGRIRVAVVVAVLLGAGAMSAGAGNGRVVVPRGQPIQIAVVLDRSTPIGAQFTPAIRNAIQWAVQLQPSIRGFRIRLADGFDAPCGNAPDVVGRNADAAAAVVADAQNAAVIGHMCSLPFAGMLPDLACAPPGTSTALAIYESAGIVAINGSATATCLPSIGPTVFDRTAVADPGFDAWYARVKSLPTDRLWSFFYRLEFGSPPTDFADLYFDATRLLLARIAQVSQVENGSLVIDRAALARAVRTTTGFPGVTCAVTLDPTTGNRIDDLGRCRG